MNADTGRVGGGDFASRPAGGFIVKTNNGGNTRTPMISPTTNKLRFIVSKGSDLGLISGYAGTILGIDDLTFFREVSSINHYLLGYYKPLTPMITVENAGVSPAKEAKISVYSLKCPQLKEGIIQNSGINIDVSGLAKGICRVKILWSQGEQDSKNINRLAVSINVMKAGTAILIIDVQNDFCEGAVMAARNTNTLVKPLNLLISCAIEQNYCCIYSRDWHPPDHCSFIPRGGPWPPHCVRGTYGAKFPESLLVPHSSLMINIETEPEQQNLSYSVFENTILSEELKRLNIHHLVAAGIATEYCVKATVLDALQYGFTVTVMEDLVRPINVNPEDEQKAIREMKQAGIEFMKSREWIKTLMH